jgi:hypothetical protein
MAEFAAAATFVQLAGAACKGIGVLRNAIQTLRLADERVQKLEHQLKWTKQLLQRSKPVLGRSVVSEDENGTVYDPLEDLRSILKILDDAVEGLRDGDDVNRMKWLLSENKCARLAADLKDQTEKIFYLLILRR